MRSLQFTKGIIMAQLNDQLQYIRGFHFVQYLSHCKAQVFLVGGAVRDGCLNKDVKDLDLLVVGMGIAELQVVLSSYGVVNLVGESFGVLKFRADQNPEEEFDIAVPRAETKIGDGHQGFVVTTEGITLEQDLLRRDFTINSMAVNVVTGEVCDHQNGAADIKNKVIRLTNSRAFGEDPLRMLRAIQFSARFGFMIEPYTLSCIIKNRADIKEISGERILTELEKMVTKGNPNIGAQLLHLTGLWEEITGFSSAEFMHWYHCSDKWFDGVETVAEFVQRLTKSGMQWRDVETLWKDRLKGDLAGLGEIQAIQIANNDSSFESRGDYGYAFHLAMKKSKRILVTKSLHPDQEETRKQFLNGEVPHGLHEVEINGEDLMALGYQGKTLGLALKRALWGIYEGEVLNEKAALLAYVQDAYSLPSPHENPTINPAGADDAATGTR